VACRQAAADLRTSITVHKTHFIAVTFFWKQKTSLLNILAGRASSHGTILNRVLYLKARIRQLVLQPKLTHFSFSLHKGRLTIEADVRLNNYSVDPTNINVRKQIAFVAQDDSLQVTSTPREAIRFSAKLRLSRKTSEHDLDKLTERMISELGLTSCADTIVGGALIKGISGGERKRTSVGVELVGPF